MVFAASSSSDPSGRPLASIVWGQDGSNPVLSAVINKANDAAGTAAGSYLLSLPQSSIIQLADGVYTLTVTVSSFLGQSATAKLSFSKVGPGVAPVVSIVGGTSQSFKIADGIKLAAVLDPKSVCGSKKVRVCLM